MKKLKRKQVQNYVKKNVNDKLYNIWIWWRRIMKRKRIILKILFCIKHIYINMGYNDLYIYIYIISLVLKSLSSVHVIVFHLWSVLFINIFSLFLMNLMVIDFLLNLCCCERRHLFPKYYVYNIIGNLSIKACILVQILVFYIHNDIFMTFTIYTVLFLN